LTLEEVVPGATTVLVLAASPADLVLLRPHLPEGGEPGERREGPVVELAVHYDGPDLEDVGRMTGLGADGVVAAHCGVRYRGAFSGFAPGFCYLEGLPEALRVPRRSDPRPTVPPGSVAIADRWSAVYPRASPGGWRLLGTTTEVLWDPTRTPPARIGAGTVVVFHPA
jgi:KipI family sensor histidine kinase inhibitor